MRRRALLLVILIGTSSCIGPFSEEYQYHYPNVSAARADGAFSRGWIPEIVPADATDIYIFYNIDTNWTWGCFRLPRDGARVREALAAIRAERVAGPVDSGPPRFYWVLHRLPGTLPWWPTSMRSPGIEMYRFIESPKARLLSPYVVRVGIDENGKAVCFHRRL